MKVYVAAFHISIHMYVFIQYRIEKEKKKKRSLFGFGSSTMKIYATMYKGICNLYTAPLHRVYVKLAMFI